MFTSTKIKADRGSIIVVPPAPAPRPHHTLIGVVIAGALTAIALKACGVPVAEFVRVLAAMTA